MLGFNISEINYRRLQNFKANKRGYRSFKIFLFLFFFTLFAEFISNDKPILIKYDNSFYFPIFQNYTEKTFDGDFETYTDYKDPYIKKIIESDGWIIWPLIPYSHDTINYLIPTPAPSPPDTENWLGTDDQGRDVFARLIYGFRISVLFGLSLTLFSSIIGIAAGAVQGFFGGIVDLIFQRIIEIWSGLPVLYILIILGKMILTLTSIMRQAIMK